MWRMGQGQSQDVLFQPGRRPSRRLGRSPITQVQGVQPPAQRRLAPAVVRRGVHPQDPAGGPDIAQLVGKREQS